MFGSDDLRDKLPSLFLKILKLLSFYWGSFKLFQNVLGQFIPNLPPKHVGTSANWCKTEHIKLTKFWSNRLRLKLRGTTLCNNDATIFFVVISKLYEQSCSNVISKFTSPGPDTLLRCESHIDFLTQLLSSSRDEVIEK